MSPQPSAADGDVAVTRADGVMTLTLQREAKRNALTQPMYAALVAALDRAVADDDVRAVRFRGAGADFCAGNDLDDFATALANEAPESLPVVRFLHAVIDFPKPLVAQVQGNAVGVGTTLLLHCDLTVAATNASLRLPFVPLGVVPEFASSRLLAELVGRQRATRWLLLGDPVDAVSARDAGLVAHVCEAQALDAVGNAHATRLAAMPPQALQATRALMQTAERRAELHETVDREWRKFREHLAGEEHRQAMAAYRQRR